MLRLQCLIITEKGLARGGPGGVTYRMSQAQSGERRRGWVRRLGRGAGVSCPYLGSCLQVSH